MILRNKLKISIAPTLSLTKALLRLVKSNKESGQDINDSVTDFIKGLALGPFAILSGLDPRSQKNGKSKGLISGGIVGMVSFFITYFSL